MPDFHFWQKYKKKVKIFFFPQETDLNWMEYYLWITEDIKDHVEMVLYVKHPKPTCITLR